MILRFNVYYPCVAEANQHPDVIDRVVHAYFGLLRPHGRPPSVPALDLTMGQLRLLFRLHHEGPASMGEIARLAACSLQSATALVERIERRGLVVRDRRDGDRRIVECRLTKVGEDLVAEIAGDRAATLRQALVLLDPDELLMLHQLLTAMLERQGDPACATSDPACATSAPREPRP